MRTKGLYIRATEIEMDEWRALAEQEGLTLSDWVRGKLAGDAHKSAEAVAGKLDDAVNPEADPPTRKRVKACEHGVIRGWHCWQCKGVAVA